MKKIFILSIFILSLSVLSSCTPNTGASIYDESLYALNDIDIILNNEKYLNTLIESYPSETSNSEETMALYENLDFSNPKAAYEISGYKSALINDVYTQMGITLTEEELNIVLKSPYGGIHNFFYDLGTLDFHYIDFWQTLNNLNPHRTVFYEGLQEDLMYIFVYDNNIIGVATIEPVGTNIVKIIGHVSVNQSLTEAENLEEAKEILWDSITKFTDADSSAYDEVKINELPVR